MFENPADRFVPGALKAMLTKAQQKALAIQGGKNVGTESEDDANYEQDQRFTSPIKAKPSPTGANSAAKEVELM